ncbi:MAG TPA: enolase C-terminal domain-like protein [Anaerolineae bacterium]|nr:enolase C-terminal domain-like protein [Anaerolineae bacterium]
MQITRVEVTPVTLDLRVPYRSTSHIAGLEQVHVVFIRVETREGRSAWGCAAFDTALTGETMEQVVRACRACADRARDLNPLNTEFALAELAELTEGTPSARCAFDIAFYDLLGLAAGLPLHRLLGGYRNRILTSATVNLGSVRETVGQGQERARHGFRILKVKGGADPEEDVLRIHALRQALPGLVLRLDADQGYTVRQALDVARALQGEIEMLEQPGPAGDLDAMEAVTRNSAVPILADESVSDPPSALALAGRRAAHGLSVKLVTCGGLHCAHQVDAIARAAGLATMIGCVNEPALLIAAGLGLALSSPNVRYADLDGHFDLLNDPSRPGFVLEEGWLVARDVPGLGCTVEL